MTTKAEEIAGGLDEAERAALMVACADLAPYEKARTACDHAPDTWKALRAKGLYRKIDFGDDWGRKTFTCPTLTDLGREVASILEGKDHVS